MDDNDIAYAVKVYTKKKKAGGYTFEDFVKDIIEHKERRTSPYNMYDPLSINFFYAPALWKVLEMNMKDIVEYSKLDMAKFARRFCIPYRTLQSWCDGTNECPIYTKMMICEIYKLYNRIVYVH